MYWVNCHEACNWCSKNPTISHHITETRRARENHYVRMARTVDSSRGYKRYFVCLNVISTIVVKIKKYNAFLPFSIKKGINCISLCWSLPETTLGWNAIVLKKLVCWKSGANQDTECLKMPSTHHNVLSRARPCSCLGDHKQEVSARKCLGVTTAPSPPGNLKQHEHDQRRNESAARWPGSCSTPIADSADPAGHPHRQWIGPLIPHLKNGNNSPLSVPGLLH